MDKVLSDTENKVSKYMASHRQKIESINQSYSKNMKKLDSKVAALKGK